jgi:hypothetical protein
VGACGHVGRGLSDCTPRIGIVSAFGAEADILLAQTTGQRTWNVNGKPFTTGVLRGNRVVIVLSGVGPCRWRCTGVPTPACPTPAERPATWAAWA